MTAVVFLGAVTTLMVGLLVLRAGEHARLRGQLIGLRLTFPRELSGDAVASFVAGLSGLLPPWWRRWLVRPFVVLEVRASSDDIEHWLLVPRTWLAVVENLLQAALPSVRYEQSEFAAVALFTEAKEYRISSHQRALRAVSEEHNLKLLTSLQPLGRGEGVTVQWLLAPAGPVAPARIASGGESNQLVQTDGVLQHSEEVAALKQKQSSALLLGTARLGVRAESVKRARQVLRQVESTWHETRAPGVHMSRRLLPSSLVIERLRRVVVPLLAWPGTFNAEELAGLIGWPVNAQAVPGVVLSGYRQLAVSPLVPSVGTVLGDGTFPGSRQPLAMDVEARLRHLHVLGPTGTGKSTLLVNMAVQDLQAGRGVIVIDPKRDLLEDILARVPDHRRKDVVVLDPGDDERPVGLNPLRAASQAGTEVVVENLVGLFKSLYRASWGPRTDDILRASLLALARQGDATLCEVPLLLTDSNYRRRIVGSLDDPVGLGAFFGWYERLSTAEQLAVIGPVLNKLRAFTMRPRVRRIIGQREPKLAMHEVLERGGVLLVSLSTGLLGEEAAALLGALVVAELWHATGARARLAQASRRPVMAYLDEWQHFLHLPTPMATVLAEARGLGLGLTLAHQSLGQLPEEARQAVLANARSRVVFQLPADDARTISRESGGLLSPNDLQGLGAYEVVAQVFAAGATQPPATGRTRAMSPPTSRTEQLRQASRQRFGVDSAEIEADLRSRHALTIPDAPIGRRPGQRRRT